MMKKKIILFFLVSSAILMIIGISINKALTIERGSLLVDKRDKMFTNQSRDKNEKTSLSLEQVLKDPDAYNERTIIIDCYYLEAFETNVLASKINVNSDGSIQVMGGDVWVAWHITPPEDLINKLKTTPSFLGNGAMDLYGRVEVQGIFRKMKDTGHLGEYNYVFEIQRFRVYDENIGKFIP